MPAPGGKDRVCVYKANGLSGVCRIVYTKTGDMLPNLRCLTCAAKNCGHIRDLKEVLQDTEENEHSTAGVFKDTMNTPPSLRNYYQLVCNNKRKIPLFDKKGMIVYVCVCECFYVCVCV